jgi:NADH:ubiquinone oxidoreductase subunit 5 (subunit L)/multisubunit Na+/H+ antiporter MnhA subunit
MRAPTPVRALVHRSTLVTAGLILIINFSFFVFSVNVLLFFVFVGVFTMFFSSIMSLLEQDMKKVVALSTLSQIGMATIVLGLGLFFFCVFHLFSHALFKSCLFIQVGVLIYFFFGSQDGRGFGGGWFFCFFLITQMLITLFCLCGLFFFCGIVSKDIVLEFGYSFSLG